MRDQTNDSKLLFAQNAIANALAIKEVSTLLAQFGYTSTRIKEGEALYETAKELQAKQIKEYGEQYEATNILQLARAMANKTYIVHVKIARIALRNNPETNASLQLMGSRKNSLSGWLKQANAFYTNALNTPKVLASLAKFNINKKQLEEGKALVSKLESSFNAQLKEKGEAQVATKERDAAMDELQDWMSDFVAIARIALASEPQLLEMLGIIEPS